MRPDFTDRKNTAMKKRGKVLRDTTMGNGLLMVDGRQFPFTLEGMWQSEDAPRVGAVVEVEFSGDDTVAGIVALSETVLAREQAEQAIVAARAKGAQLASGMVGRFGLPTLVALGALALAWAFFNTVTVQANAEFKVGITFWKLLGMLNSPSGILASLNGSDSSAGLYGLLALAALLAPLAPQFWADRRAHLGGLMPLAFMLVVALMVYNGISSSMGEAQSMVGMVGGKAGEMVREMQAEMARQAMRAVSLGVGFYMAAAASLYLAARGSIKFLANAN